MTARGEWLPPGSAESRAMRRAMDDFRLGDMQGAVKAINDAHLSPEAVVVTLARYCVDNLGITPASLIEAGGLAVGVAADDLPTQEDFAGMEATGMLVMALVMCGPDECIELFHRLPDGIQERAISGLMSMACHEMDADDARDN